jgi:hypothetical protein
MPGIGDFNNDGHNDVVVACYTANAVTLLLNNGAGSLGAASSWPAGTGPYTGIAIGDFNNDSRLDLAVADDAAGANSSAVLLGNGNGTFTPPTINAAGTSPIDAEAADLNSDGVMDYAVANLNSNDVTVYLSYGDGGFTSQSIAVGGHPMGGLPRSLALADVNGDSKPDILVSNFNSNFVTVVLNTTP